MSEQVESIDLSVLGKFGIGQSSKHLYFDGHKVHTDSFVTLTPAQTAFAVLVGIATIISAVGTTAYNATYIWDTAFRVKDPAKVEIVPSQAEAVQESPPVDLFLFNSPSGSR